MSTRRIEITEDRINDGRETRLKGDIVTVAKDKADKWIARGWARDPETGEQGERKPGPVKLDVQNVKQNTGGMAK